MIGIGFIARTTDPFSPSVRRVSRRREGEAAGAAAAAAADGAHQADRSHNRTCGCARVRACAACPRRAAAVMERMVFEGHFVTSLQ